MRRNAMLWALGLISLSLFVITFSVGGCNKKEGVDCDELAKMADLMNSQINDFHIVMAGCRRDKPPEECDEENKVMNPEIDDLNEKLQALAAKYSLNNCDDMVPFPTPMPPPTAAPDFPDEVPDERQKCRKYPKLFGSPNGIEFEPNTDRYEKYMSV